MPLTHNVQYTLADNGSRESVLTEHADGSSTAVYRVTDTGGNGFAASFTGTDLVAAWNANAAYFADLKAANPGVDGATLATYITLVRAVFKAYGDNACGFAA